VFILRASYSHKAASQQQQHGGPADCSLHASDLQHSIEKQREDLI
jgi:hypothetical protein